MTDQEKIKELEERIKQLEQRPFYTPVFPAITVPDQPKVGNPEGCMHKGCTSCGGSGMKYTGGSCIHMMSCPCRSCTPYL